jgi:stearoyl-CoA desaturase (delta-9 desaturase)
MKILSLPTERINWVSSSFLIGTALLSVTAVPLYLWYFGFDWFHFGTFFVMFLLTGFSITAGYHRFFAHKTYEAKWPLRLMVLLFGAGAFENSVLMWTSDHRRHHKHTDHDDDPYNIQKGFFHAHMGWILFKLDAEPPLDNVPDLERDPLVRWQHRYVHVLAVLVGFVLPSLAGFLYDGWVGALGGLLIGGVARVVATQHTTFFINSACHCMGRQPYSTRCSARDSFFLALFTLGEGYHNYHHEFQYDYRNGVKPWQWDPTKWLIWVLSKIGVTSHLRRVPDEKIVAAQQAVQMRLAPSESGSLAMSPNVGEPADPQAGA